jgi:2-oxoglutarate ferredoxin oxidoreductase subunit gamma
MPRDRYEFIAAGLGGQGVLTIGLTLARAGLKRFKYVTWLPNYDTFMRGGDVICYVVLSQDEIASPIISKPKTMIFLSRTALDTYENMLQEGGIAILDTSLIDREIKRNDLRAIYIPAMDMAQEIGSTVSQETALTDMGSGFIPTRTIDIEAGRRISNLILLGAYLRLTEAIPLEAIEEAITELLKGSRKEGLIQLNKAALRAGYEKVKI